MMSVLLEFSMFPLDKGESVKEEVAEVIAMIKRRGVGYQLTAMGTLIETETMSEALAIVQSAYDVLEPLSNRIYATLKFDIRKGKNERLMSKIASIEEIIGKVST